MKEIRKKNEKRESVTERKMIDLKMNIQEVDTWLTEFRIDQIHVVLQKGYILYA